MKTKERLVKAAKNMIPLELLYFIKYHSKLRQKKELSIPGGRRRIFLLDSPHYGNIGDQAIAYAIQKFAHTYFDDYSFVDIQQEELPHYIDELKKCIMPEDIIFMVGGGNMGNIYKIYEATRRIVFREFPDNKIVVFPQTMEYTKDIFGKLSKRRSRKIYNNHNSLLILAREEISYKNIQSLYPCCKVVLCPDIVLSLDGIISSTERNGIGVCLRHDCERRLTDEDREEILKSVAMTNKSIREITTITDTKYITSNMREGLVLSKIEEISKCELLITDRLHAMIFAAVSKTPCIAFNNTNRKIEGVYKWISNRNYIKMVNGLDEFHSVIKSMSNVQTNIIDALPVFSEIAEFIKGD